MIARIKALLARVPARVKAQAARFARVFVFAAVPAAIAGWHVHHVLLAVLGAAVTAGAEAVWRQLRLPPEAKQLLGLLAELKRRPAVPVTTTNSATVTVTTQVTRAPTLPVKEPAPTPAQIPAKKTPPKPPALKGGVLGAGAVPASPPPPKPAAKKAAAAPAKKPAAKKA